MPVRRLFLGFISIAAVATLVACASNTSVPASLAGGTSARIGVLETTDLHTHVLSYDYYKLEPDLSGGLDRAATLIKQARREFTNSLLFDDGDTIQGTPLADYQALVARPKCNEELAIYKAMDTLDYDAGTIGNHEFNYGLDFLSQVTGTPYDVDGVPVEKCAGPNYPLVLSNVFSLKTGKPLYAPWRIITRNIAVTTPDGDTRKVPIRFGIVGFTPPQIMDWDRRHLEGKVRVMGDVEAAEKYVPEVRAAGADIVVALIHGGVNTSPYTDTMANAGWYLSKVPGIDIILLGHSHQKFPDAEDRHPRYSGLPGVDDTRGALNGVPAVMGDFHGKAIGVIDLALAYKGGHWQVDRQNTHAEVRMVRDSEGNSVAPDEAITTLVQPEHKATIAYVKTPIGHTDFAMNTWFVAAGGTSALQIVNMAQRAYVADFIETNMKKYAGIPVVSAASPFKAGFAGPNDYTAIPPGPLAIYSAADLYLYANTLTAVKTDGAGIRAWLEQSARWFNRIDPADKDTQQLTSSRVPTYNFDVIQGGITYDIDITRPAGQRIVDLRYNGEPVTGDMPFIVATNNYRAYGGGRFPGLDGSNVIFSAPDTNRAVIIDYIKHAGTLTRARFGNDRNWRFVKVKTAGPVVFTSASGKLDMARAAGINNVSLVHDNGDGTSVYGIDLDR
ncbi:MAG TPA: bifunctional 2',3'-cyclic-nucleotide 2'-phosphodiesterase/3'-nucleotidase [Pseudomonadales bacterium]|nr:bifunctional 2',3'-cyclic-nucleotide 2'-phosphodiesterase/3'-nucleotidase [Pseudomonadales bacterium]